MESKLFTNVVMVNADTEAIKRILSNPQHMLQWIPDISTVDNSRDGFIIRRHEAALNPSEFIQVKSDGQKVIYTSTGGRLEYRLVFLISTQNNQSVIQEELYIPDDTKSHLPVKLLAPIAKHAFHTNLINLRALVEMMISKKG